MAADSVVVAGTLVDVTVPTLPGRCPGVSMAGFQGRAAGPDHLPVVPFPAVTMFIDLGDMAMVEDAGGSRVAGSGVVGLCPIGVYGQAQTVDLLQVRLSPVVAYATLGGSPEVSGGVIGLDELWGHEVELLRERMHESRSWDERFAILDDALTTRHRSGPAVDPEVRYAWRRIILSGGQIRVEALADEIGWSRKRLWSRFRTQIGLTPKRAAQLVRFDDATHRLAAGSSAARVSAESGYADQSHFSRETMTFAGLTPTALADAPWLAVDPVAWAGGRALSRAGNISSIHPGDARRCWDPCPDTTVKTRPGPANTTSHRAESASCTHCARTRTGSPSRPRS
ncbi:helix-turn-helix domain-containing protein [Nocardia sp. NPDC004340]